MVPLTTTLLEVYVTIRTTVLFHLNHYLEETFNHLKRLKLKSYNGYNIANLCDTILVYTEHRESYRFFIIKHIGYITCIVEVISS